MPWLTAQDDENKNQNQHREKTDDALYHRHYSMERERMSGERNATAPGSRSRLPPLAPEPLGFGHKHDATVDIPLDTMNEPKKKEKELASWEADLKRREKDIKRREDAVARAGIPIDDKNWPPFFPIIHHDISNEIPVHAQRLQYLAFASWLGMNVNLLLLGLKGCSFCFCKLWKQ
ncbi:hypothetical protein HHK36_028244 [Tetracentron sinense]|uniref:Secretory carrier-associated membrane protein n=1 Tax=Tetracentron sinense TaxID=13715 RepID=A0A834YJ29_TETSI|nr:hypothetical protein HHK36_028244 [Tetracentron sinense]